MMKKGLLWEWQRWGRGGVVEDALESLGEGREELERDRERDEVAWMRLGELGFVGECVVCMC